MEPDPVAARRYRPDIIVLLTDGASNAGPEPLEAAKQAAARGLRVYTIGFGTALGGELEASCRQQFLGNEPNLAAASAASAAVRRRRRRVPARDRRGHAARRRRHDRRQLRPGGERERAAGGVQRACRRRSSPAASPSSSASCSWGSAPRSRAWRCCSDGPGGRCPSDRQDPLALSLRRSGRQGRVSQAAIQPVRPPGSPP